MEKLSELPLGGQSLRSTALARRVDTPAPQYVDDPEFPPDLPGTYDWMLQPASTRRWRRAMRFLAVAFAVGSIAAASYFIYRWPGSLAYVGAALAGCIVFIILLKALSHVLRARPVFRRFPQPEFNPSASVSAHLPRL
jgi:hypothetical protein